MQVPCFNLHFYSPNYQASLVFYRDVIGIPVKYSYEHPGRCGVVFAVNEHTELEFIDLADHAKAEKYMPPPQTLRIKFVVADVDAEYVRIMETDGIMLVEDIADHSWGERSFAVQAPDGLIVHISTPNDV